MSARFERRFEGKDNAGLRALIRQRVKRFDAGETGFASRAEAVRSLRTVVALTASGLATLEQVAEDHEGISGNVMMMDFGPRQLVGLRFSPRPWDSDADKMRRAAQAYVHERLSSRGHIPIREDNAVECPRCGRRGSVSPYDGKEPTISVSGDIVLQCPAGR